MPAGRVGCSGYLRAVLVSDVSPARGHVWGLRVSAFARAMARRGHQIVLLSPADAASDRPVSPREATLSLAGHDWSTPLHLAVAPERHRLLEVAREPRLPAVLRRPLTACLLAVDGGVHGDWERGARPLTGVLADAFRPHIVWSVFGNTSTLVVGQRLARRARVPWMMDIKDNWELYTPPALRPILAYRFRDAAGFTTNAALHGCIAARWLGKPSLVLHSGVAEAMAAPPSATARRDVFLLTLVGSTYSDDNIRQFLAAFAAWLQRLAPPERTQVRLRYAGVSEAEVRRALAAMPALGCPVEVTGNVAHAELATLCQSAMANCYLWAPFGFHHKMLELMATRRPAVSFPGEHGESILLAREVAGTLLPCANGAALMAAFDGLWWRWKAGDVAGSPTDISGLSWDAGAVRLEALLADSVRQATQPASRLRRAGGDGRGPNSS